MTTKPKTTRKRRTKKNSVVSIWGTAPPVPQVDPDVVERCEHLLARARDGLIVGLASVAVECNGTLDTGWCGKAEDQRLVSGMARLQHAMIEAWRDA